MIKKIDMNGDTFASLKNSMTLHIKDLLHQMERYGTDCGSVGVKIDVQLFSTEQGVMPFFKYKVTSAVQIKDESKGQMGGNCTLEIDENGIHQLNFLDPDNQVSMFDASVE